MEFIVNTADRYNYPIYQQIVDQVRTGIISGELPPFTRLPATRDLANRLRINSLTVARAYRTLEKAGYIETRSGSGSYIAVSALEKIKANARHSLDNALDEVRTLSCLLRIPPASVAQMLLNKCLDVRDISDRNRTR